MKPETVWTFLNSLVQDYHKKKKVYDKLGFKIKDGISSKDWEALAALLLNDRGSGKATGPDLLHYEVKSAKQGNDYEYQYHRKNGLKKLDADRSVDHIYVVYNENYRDGTVVFVDRLILAPVFNIWETEIREAYSRPRAAGTPTDRCRKNLPSRFVETNGHAIYRWSGMGVSG